MTEQPKPKPEPKFECPFCGTALVPARAMGIMHNPKRVTVRACPQCGFTAFFHKNAPQIVVMGDRQVTHTANFG